MATIIGPENTVESTYPIVPNFRGWYRSRSKYKCSPKRATPLPYYLFECKCGLYDTVGIWQDAPNTWAGSAIRTETNPPELVTASSKAYSRFVDKVKSSAGWGENLAQRAQAISMINSRGMQIVRAFNAVRKGKIGKAFTELGLLPNGTPRKVPKRKPRYQPLPWRDVKPPRKRSGSKSKRISDTWLELHFGWDPLVQDIYDSVNLLQSPFPYFASPIRATGSGQRVPFDGGFCSAKVLYQAEASVSNPNLFFANQLGLANPIGLLWELLPFSFVVDWFTTVGQFLNSFMDFVGVTFSKAFTTVYRKYAYPRTGQESVTVSRSLGISAPVLGRKTFNGFSVTRGATAIALVLTSFKHGLP